MELKEKNIPLTKSLVEGVFEKPGEGRHETIRGAVVQFRVLGSKCKEVNGCETLFPLRSCGRERRSETDSDAGNGTFVAAAIAINIGPDPRGSIFFRLSF